MKTPSGYPNSARLLTRISKAKTQSLKRSIVDQALLDAYACGIQDAANVIPEQAVWATGGYIRKDILALAAEATNAVDHKAR